MTMKALAAKTQSLNYLWLGNNVTIFCVEKNRSLNRIDCYNQTYTPLLGVHEVDWSKRSFANHQSLRSITYRLMVCQIITPYNPTTRCKIKDKAQALRDQSISLMPPLAIPKTIPQ